MDFVKKDIKKTTMREYFIEERERLSKIENLDPIFFKSYGDKFDRTIEEIYADERKDAEEDEFYGCDEWICYICGEIFEIDDEILRFSFYRDDSWEFQEESNYHIKCMKKLLEEMEGKRI